MVMPPRVPTFSMSWLVSWLVAPNATVRLPPAHMPLPVRSGASVTVMALVSMVCGVLPMVVSDAMAGLLLARIGVPVLVTVMALVDAAKAETVPLLSQPAAAARLKLWVVDTRAAVPFLSSSASTAA